MNNNQYDYVYRLGYLSVILFEIILLPLLLLNTTLKVTDFIGIVSVIVNLMLVIGISIFFKSKYDKRKVINEILVDDIRKFKEDFIKRCNKIREKDYQISYASNNFKVIRQKLEIIKTNIKYSEIKNLEEKIKKIDYSIRDMKDLFTDIIPESDNLILIKNLDINTIYSNHGKIEKLFFEIIVDIYNN